MSRLATAVLWAALLLLPTGGVLLAVILQSDALGLGASAADPLAVLAIVSGLAVVPWAAYRRTRSLSMTIGASALAFALAGLILFVVIVAVLASVGES